MPTKRNKSTRIKSASGSTAATRASVASAVACWEDDPGDPKTQPALTPISVAAPNPSATPLPFKISGTTPTAKVYPVDTPSFRYYAAAVALRRTADFWAGIIPAGTKWNVGATLPVNLDDGVDLNAFYTRGGEGGGTPGLHFFHDTVSGRTYFSGESPDVVCHEMGHGVLDALRPQLFNANTIEAAAFHESFGDMSALLSGLQVPSFCQEVINETQGTLNRASRLSRVAEQLGAAIRVGHPDAVDPDCLRNATNSFFYTDPQTLPTSAPASALSSEPHSFSRVFTAAFLDSLAGIAKILNPAPTAASVQKATLDAARLLVGGILAAPVVPDYFSQVAAHMIAVGQVAPFNGKYRDVLKSAFIRRGILSLQAATTITSTNTAASHRLSLTAAAGRPLELPKATISAAAFGLKVAGLKVFTAEDAKQFAVTSSSLTLGALPSRSAQNAAESYTEDLFQRGRIDVGDHADPESGLISPSAFRTHVIVREDGDLVLKRIAFACGFD